MNKKKTEEKKFKIFKEENKSIIFAIILSLIWLIIISIGSLKENFGKGLIQVFGAIYTGGFLFIVMSVLYSIGLGLWCRFKQKEETYSKAILITLGICIAFTIVNNNFNANRRSDKYINTSVETSFKYYDADISMEDFFDEYEKPDSYHVPNYIKFIREQLVENTNKRLIVIDDKIEYNGETIYLDDIYDPNDKDSYIDLTKLIDKINNK